ncbi:MAG TPA: DUF5700 domain-containing putative Zn-dependent protease, partial [Bryobacteraceae bacterium]|nr:DUF5700 domain-containing putative Zn-dependent protease [Bryobacteraceae bacterium]
MSWRELLPLLLLYSSAANALGVVDTAQSQAMIDLLDNCAAGTVPPGAVEQVMALPGTQLVIAQQNISRRITSEQYRATLASACKGEIARLQPLESAARAQKGVEGLTGDVASSLLWGRDHVAFLRQRLASAKEIQGLGEIVPFALQNLPQKVALSPKLYFVMGGRAGAAAIDNAIYIDLLADAWRARENNAPMTPQQIIEFFAHETHHVGYGQILEGWKQQLRLTGGREQAWNFLAALLMEGSATLLVSAHGSWTELEKQRHIQADLSRLPQLLPKAQSLLRQAMNGGMSEQEYQSALSDYFGEGYHATGAWMLKVILEVQGKRGVLGAMRNPANFLTVYNRCAA